jgi:hypothetical protein
MLHMAALISCSVKHCPRHVRPIQHMNAIEVDELHDDAPMVHPVKSAVLNL